MRLSSISVLLLTLMSTDSFKKSIKRPTTICLLRKAVLNYNNLEINQPPKGGDETVDIA